MRSLRLGPLLGLPKPLSTESLPPLAPEHPLGTPDPFSPQLSSSSRRTLGYGTLWSVSCGRCCGVGKAWLPTSLTPDGTTTSLGHAMF